MGQTGSIPNKITNPENSNEDIELKGYRINRLRATCGYLALIFTLGLLYILLAWRKDLKMWLFYQECPIQHAAKILCKVTKKAAD